jgi:DNA polymerase-3 subunit delta'
MEIYKKQWEFLKEKYVNNQLSHAYIFSGQDTESIKAFAGEFIKQINCLYSNLRNRENRSISGEACGKCQNCMLVEKSFDPAQDKGAFPDLIVVKSIDSPASIKNEKDNLEIQIEQIKDVNNFLNYKSYYGGVKAVIFENAERMNRDAQDCFLKNLEEPKGKTLIILISSKPEMLLPTISSRCQLVKFFGEKDYAKEDEEALKELLPIINADLAEKFQYVKKANLEGRELNGILNILQRYFRNLMLIKIGAIRGEAGNIEKYSIEKLTTIIRLIEKISYQLSVTNANPKLALEILLLEI